MKHFLLGTAGHVDHGKTSLIKALTGVDTDRLPQEKKRGLSIELGFASLRLQGLEGKEDISIGIIDVPGHQRYLRSAISGVGGFDAALLIIDSSVGVKPQTREHLRILDLLCVRFGIVVLSKVDRVDDDTLQLVRWEIGELVGGTFLEKSDIVEVSIYREQSLHYLKEKLYKLFSAMGSRSWGGFARLPIDRVFSKTGFGPVVTGSLWSGSLTLGQEVELKPDGLLARIRGLQVYGLPVDEAVCGQRVAVNLSGLELDELKRGQTLADPAQKLSEGKLFSVAINGVTSLPAKAITRLQVMFYQATWHCKARLVVVEDSKKDQQYLGQLKFSTPVFLCPGDRFLIRDATDQLILGGGSIVALDPQELRKKELSQWLARTQVFANGDMREAVLSALRAAGGKMKEEKLCQSLAITPAAWDTLASKLQGSAEAVFSGGGFVWEATSFELYRKSLVGLLLKLQAAASWKAGWPREELARLLDFRSGRDSGFAEALNLMVARKELVQRGGLFATVDHEPSLPAEAKALATSLENNIYADGVNPRDWSLALKEVTSKDQVAQMISCYLLATAKLERLTEKLVFSSLRLQEAYNILLEHSKGEPFTTSEARQWLHTSRKFVIPILEWMDRKGWTNRVGDHRIAIV